MTVDVGSKRQLAMRWKAKKPNDASFWNLIQYVSTAKSKDTVIRVGKAVLIVELILLTQTRGDRIRESRRSTLYTESEVRRKEKMVKAKHGVQQLESRDYYIKRNTYFWFTELAETDVKTSIGARQQATQAETVREQTIVVQRYIERMEGNQSAISQLPCTPGPSLDASSSINSENTPIKRQKLRQATVTGRMKTQNPTRRLNATVPVLLSGWWTKSELSLLRLARRACPSIPGSKAKPKFPEDMIEAITNKIIS
ncbi:hypothetical protein OUZ56_032777 [Daphnia magna]|uniref:Uncharacterized protein n=1 Tax=Daphnia magna TaxID=35525 RepID=A0ABQ9ZX31_9CRUS|nr:hypothetical protein OUZ56_032777 [Daphnia magna]